MKPKDSATAEHIRLEQSRDRKVHWKRWGPYLSERAWGTVREDYSARGDAWDDFPHDHARSRAYRWNEDGIAGICDRHQVLCFALAMWNGTDPILKERLFGLTGTEGNHGEDVKEIYHYVDSTPTHSYMHYAYKYPQREYPYAQLVDESRARTRNDPELELVDTGIFDEGRYFDVQIEYAKSDPDDICIRIEAFNRGPDAALIELVPSLWFRNTWSWGLTGAKRREKRGKGDVRPSLSSTSPNVVIARHEGEGARYLYCEDGAELLFTENDTNTARLYGVPNASPHVKDAFHAYIVNGDASAICPQHHGTKCGVRYRRMVPPGASTVVKLRLSRRVLDNALGPELDTILSLRKREADDFYDAITPSDLTADARDVMRQALAGVLWSKQFYHYVVNDWLEGDPGFPPPPAERKNGRNREWRHLYNADVISMPDKWEYPWYAAWDLAFHCVPLAMVDADFAKEQLILMLREWYMHPNGQIPAYEWAFGDVNPPVHAWAAWRVYKIDKKRTGFGDRTFLARVFQKLMLNFTWWVNRKDEGGRNVFQGGFLGLDNIGVFDRSKPLPTGGHLEQSDGTSWMAMYCLNMLAIALELASEDPAYEDVASKFWEHFVFIADAINTKGLWNEDDGFYYDLLNMPSGEVVPLRVRSMVGLIPLFAVESLEKRLLERLPAFKRRLEWFIDNRTDLTAAVSPMRSEGKGGRRLLAIVDRDRLARVLQRVFDETEFFSRYGVRALSRRHKDAPFELMADGVAHRVAYEPGESSSPLFGGNSNWRGPIWFPVNFLLVESLQKFHYYFGDTFKVEVPTGSGQWLTLEQAAAELSRRLTSIFLRDGNGRRPVLGGNDRLHRDPTFSRFVPFYEYFHGDDGSGLGARAQTGWTALVAKLLQQSGV